MPRLKLPSFAYRRAAGAWCGLRATAHALSPGLGRILASAAGIRHAARGTAHAARALASAIRGLAGVAKRRARAPASVPPLPPAHTTASGWLDHERTFRARAYARSRNRDYAIHLPPSYDPRRPLPLVMVLHGCQQRHRDIQRISGFDAVADRRGFAVVYPFVTSYAGWRLENCWGWWLRDQIRPGKGEVQDLWEIAEEVRSEFNIDPRRIHVTGLSSGGGMAIAALVAHPHRFASGAAVAGVPYSETAAAVGLTRRTNGVFKAVPEVSEAMSAAMGERKRAVPVFIVHSHRDTTVHIRAAENIRDSWGHCFGVDTSEPSGVRSGATRGARWRYARYRGSDRRTLIETLFLEDGEHGWYGGRPGRFSHPDAPDISEMMWDFFRAHPLERRSAQRQATEAA